MARKVAVAAAVVAAVVVAGVAFAAVSGSGGKRDYSGPCPSGPGAAGLETSGPVGSTTVACDGLARVDDTTVVRVIELLSPKTVPLKWGFCDGLTCGTPENAECVSNLWMPQFGSQLPATVTIHGLGRNAKVTGVWVGAGPSAGDLSKVKEATWRVGSDGTVDVNLARLNDLAAKLRGAINPDFNMVCGVPEKTKDAITDEYGDSYDNADQALIRIQIEMRANQQQMNELSNILKQQSDTSKTVIANMR
jgi:hypothetical protein